MARQNSNNQNYQNNSDGFHIAGGTTERKLTLTSGDVTITGNGSGNTVTFPTGNFEVAKNDGTNLSPGALALIGSFLMPVGYIYVNKTDSTNPGTKFGFGTWVAIQGRVIVGKAASGTFATAGSTGGSETHTLSISEIPSHYHQLKINAGVVVGGAGSYGVDNSGAYQGGSLTQPQGGGAAHNNLQPYVVAYMWERTA